MAARGEPAMAANGENEMAVDTYWAARWASATRCR